MFAGHLRICSFGVILIMTSDPDHSDQGASRTRVDSMVSLMHRDLSDPDIPEGKGIIFHYFFPHTTFLKIPLSRLSETNIYLRVTIPVSHRVTFLFSNRWMYSHPWKVFLRYFSYSP